MIVERLKNSIFQSAINGELLGNFKSEKTDDILKPFTIPSTWKWVQFKDIGTFIRGNGIKRNETVESGIQCVRYGEIYTSYNYKFLNSISFIPKEKSISLKKAQKNDLLFTLTGESEYEIAKTIAYLGDDELVIGGDMGLFTNHKQNPLYLTYYMYSPFAIKYKATTCTGKMIIHTSTSKLEEMFVPLPPIEEQNRIVEKIENILIKLDEIKPLEKQIIDLKQEFPNKLFNSILYSAFNGELLNNDIELWSSNKLNEVANISTGNSISESDKKNKYINPIDSYNFIATKDLMFDHKFNYDTDIFIPKIESKFKTADINDILMCIEGGSAGKKIGMLEQKVCYGNKLCKFSTSILNPKFLYYFLQSPQFKSFFYDNMTGLIGGVSINKITNIEIKYPSIEEQNRIVEKIENLEFICQEIEEMVNE